MTVGNQNKQTKVAIQSVEEQRRYGTSYKDYMKKFDDIDMYSDPDCPFEFEQYYKKHKDE